MYTIDKEYLKALKKRINGERETLINESCNNDNEETLEKNDARIVCLERIARNVQNILSDIVLLEITEKIEDNAFTCGSTFKQVVNDFKYYNCDNERGKYPIFFIEVE